MNLNENLCMPSKIIVLNDVDDVNDVPYYIIKETIQLFNKLNNLELDHVNIVRSIRRATK